MASVHVENISAQTSEKEICDFFSFCGKIRSLSLDSTAENTQSATVTFEKETAAKTALLLDNTQLGHTQVTISEHIEQEDKPRGRIMAEYLAYGYAISDEAIEKALELDKQHGVSSRFTNALKAFDQKRKESEKANSGWRSPSSYFDKAFSTSAGRELRKFYEQGNKQVIDVHNEARHLVNLKKQQEAGMEHIPGTDRTKCNCGATAEKCPCAPGKCCCADCAKNPEAGASKGTISPGDAGMEQVPGADRTKCNCGATIEKCPCLPGKCACASCAKNPEM
ncbi:hypothetical protein B0J12DRAFT_770829 [Macrophomina phaseolina]|uniref:RRM domain-containing protein n=1 Tax=Macrophomina phaseolina TaxID=35725 RepID=A0ABQ8FUL1_9PEZI|nr:hypothetical protein B0J12DRAFT_770829 [Macrophomina phaseolina]